MEIRRIGDDRVDDARSVRRTVFVNEQGVPEDREIDGKDGRSTHFVAYDGGEPIGVARLRPYQVDGNGSEDENVTNRGDAAKVERVAVLAERRGEGIGRELMTAVEDTAWETGYREIILHAQRTVVGFYTRLGYETFGDPFEDAGIEHRKMRKKL